MDGEMNKRLFIPSSICPLSCRTSLRPNIPVQISSLGVGDNVCFTHKAERSARHSEQSSLTSKVSAELRSFLNMV